MTVDLEQRRRTVRVLRLLDESNDAYERGDKEACDALISEAYGADADVVGGIMIGEIPNPALHPAAWRLHVDAARDELARAGMSQPS
jgi:hypothetical protein